jgi:hypothetical protein
MTLRHLCLHNWRWKLFSVVLASAIWFFVDRSLPQATIIRKNPVSGLVEFQSRCPIRLLTAGQDPGPFKLEPAEADVTVTGELRVLEDIDWRDVKVFTDLAEPNGNSRGSVAEVERLVQVHLPTNLTLVKVEPASILIRRLPPAPASKSPPANPTP